MGMIDDLKLGRRIAPPRFILFIVLLVGGCVLGVATLGPGRGIMTGFDVAAAVFMVSLRGVIRRSEAEEMRAASRANDANRALLLALTFVVSLAILVAVAGELKGAGDRTGTLLVLGTLALAWLFSNIVYALHYAHLYYGDDDSDGADNRGLDFPETKEPDYWDFIYFSFTLGMTFQTSDTDVTNVQMRRIVTGQSLAAFVFNLGVIAFTINVLGGGK